MDDHDTLGSGTRRGDNRIADATPPASDQDYFWESKPGEDFGPIPPPGADRAAPGTRARRPPVAVDDASSVYDSPTQRGTPVTARLGSRRDDRRFDGRGAPPGPNRGRRRFAIVVGFLVLMVGVVAGTLVFVSRQATGPAASSATVANPDADLDALRTRDTLATATLSTPVAPLLTSTPAPPTTSPTPLTLTQITPPVSPVATRAVGAAASPAARTSPVAAGPVPPLIDPLPGLRFPTPTPARIGTPAPTRTPPAVPTARPVGFLNRVWSEQTIHKVGDQATVCGSATTGNQAELLVMAPDRGITTLGQFQPPAERFCQPLKVDQSGLYVLTLVVKDANGGELDRQSAALWAGR
ncbi:MAG: hypothetical protein U0893_18425 [Chloroflexota bacterium]